MNPRRLFIAGATGAVGAQVLVKARMLGVPVVPHVRPGSAGKLEHPDKAAFDLDDVRLVETLKGCSTVVQLIGTMRTRFSRGDTYETSDVGTTRRLVEAAKAAGTIDHVLLLSSVGAGRPLGAYLQAKAKAEALVVGSGLPFTILRPSAFEDREGQRIPVLGRLTRALGLASLQPIPVEQLASTLVYLASQRAALGETLEGTTLWYYARLVEGR